MEKQCDNCVNDNIGCDVIKKMRSDIFKLKVFNFDKYPVYLLIGGFIALAIVVVWSNFCSRVKANDTPVTVQLAVKEIKDLAKTDKDAIDKVLQTTAEKAFYQGRKEAQNEFDKNFTTLLTILTVFGIAWPLIVAYINYKANEDKLREIDNLRKDTSRGFSIFQKQTCGKLGGIMIQIAGTMQEDDAKLYCTLLSFIFLYQGESQIFSKVLDCLKEDFDKLDFWSSSDKKVQVVRTIEAFLTANVIDPQVKKIIEELQEKAIRTEVKEQDK